MGKLTDVIVTDLNDIQKNIGKEIQPEVQKLFETSVNRAMVDYYNGYGPRLYNRTNNLMSVTKTAETTASGDTIIMAVDSSSMHDYPGFEIPPYKTYEKQPLPASVGFDFMFSGGEHGHGKWLMATSIPPEMLITQDVEDEFGGQIQEIIDRKIKNLI